MSEGDELKKRKRQSEVTDYVIMKQDSANYGYSQFHVLYEDDFENNVVKKMVMEGSKFCIDYETNDCCILGMGLGAKFIKLQFSCNLHSQVEKKKCRFRAYRIAAAYLNYSQCTSLPICMQLEIQELFGASKMGFKIDEKKMTRIYL